MKNVRAFALASSLLLTLSACGGGGASEEDQALIDALAATWADEGTFPDSVEVTCAAEGFINGIGGAEGAGAYGVNSDNVADADFDEVPLSEEDARSAVGNMYDCDGFEAALLSQMGGETTPEQAACLADNVDDGPLQSLVASTFMGEAGAAVEEEFENTFETQLFAAVETCGLDS